MTLNIKLDAEAAQIFFRPLPSQLLLRVIDGLCCPPDQWITTVKIKQFFQVKVFLPLELLLLQLLWKNSNNNYDAVSVKMLTLALLSGSRQAPPPLYPITLSETASFPL